MSGFTHLPHDYVLKDSYHFICFACGYSQNARPSIFMEMGLNRGGGECLQCGIMLHLEIDPKEDIMISTDYDQWLKGEQLRVQGLSDLQEGKPCGHPGCLSHITHPCENCGRIGGRSNVY